MTRCARSAPAASTLSQTSPIALWIDASSSDVASTGSPGAMNWGRNAR
jgi:hypothetical protein